jgi:tetratricopeptide (TPR) repeat protein
MGSLGYNTDQDGHYYDNFGGTSAATPQASGIGALILSLNSDMEARAVGANPNPQVQNTIKLSADDYGSTNWDGYGRINADKAVRNLYVPQVYATIQSAINAASSGQTVYVASGTYDECVLMKAGVNLVGADSSNTIIDVGTDYTTAVYFNGVNAEVTGFKLRGYAAVNCNGNCSPSVRANSIYNSEFGIYSYGSYARIKDNSITGCTYGIMLYNYSNPRIRSPYGHNSISGSGQGVRCITHSEPKLGTTTYWGNNNITTTGYDIYATSDSPPIYAQKNYWGGGAPDSVYAPNGLVYDPYLGERAKMIACLASSNDSEPGPFDENPAATEEYERGLQFYLSDRYEEAIPHFKAVIEGYPDLKVAQFSLDELIFAYRELDKEEETLAYLEDIAVRYPNTAIGDAALRASATVLSRLGLGEKALARVSDLLERFKGTKWERDLLFEKGMIYKHNLGDQQKATEVFEDFVQRYPDDLVSEFAKLELGYDPTQPDREKAGKQGISGICLSQNHPNPFNAQTAISFTLPKSAFVKLEVYNTLGQKVRTLIETGMKAGNHSVIWNGKDSSGSEVSSAIYLYCLKAGDKTLRVRKMLLLR